MKQHMLGGSSLTQPDQALAAATLTLNPAILSALNQAR